MESLSDLLKIPGVLTTYDESEESVRFHDVEYTQDLNGNLFKLKKDLSNANLGFLSLESSLGPFEVSESYQDVLQGKLSIVIKKSGNLFFITEKGFTEYLSNCIVIPTDYQIRLYFITAPFESHACRFAPLNKDINLSNRQPLMNEPIPNKFTRTLDNESHKLISISLTQWTTLEYYLDSCPQSWKIESIKRLIGCLATELSLKANMLEMEFKGDRRRSIYIDMNDQTQLESIFNIINRISNWIFLQNRDVDTKHTLFNQQIVFLLEDEKKNYPELLRILNSAFENTKSVYQYFLLNISKEVQKNLSDLNKTLFDYISKVRQGTADLSTSLWRDFAVVLGVMILSFSPKSPEIFKDYFSWFAKGLCIYLLASFAMNALSSFWFYYGLKSNLLVWRSKLYSYLSDGEFNKLTFEPLKNTFNKFRITFFVTLFFYLLLLIAIICVMRYNQNHATGK